MNLKKFFPFVFVLVLASCSEEGSENRIAGISAGSAGDVVYDEESPGSYPSGCSIDITNTTNGSPIHSIPIVKKGRGRGNYNPTGVYWTSEDDFDVARTVVNNVQIGHIQGYAQGAQTSYYYNPGAPAPYWANLSAQVNAIHNIANQERLAFVSDSQFDIRIVARQTPTHCIRNEYGNAPAYRMNPGGTDFAYASSERSNTLYHISSAQGQDAYNKIMFDLIVKRPGAPDFVKRNIGPIKVDGCSKVYKIGSGIAGSTAPFKVIIENVRTDYNCARNPNSYHCNSNNYGSLFVHQCGALDLQIATSQTADFPAETPSES